MHRDLVFMVSLVAVLFIVWVALKVSIRVRKARADQIRKTNLAGYVMYVNNFNKGEEAEQRGNKREALRCFKRALASLELEQERDDLLEGAISEVKSRIAALEEKLSLQEE